MIGRFFGLLLMVIVVLVALAVYWPAGVIALIVLGAIGWVNRKEWRERTATSSVCPHCGHDSGVLATVAPVCQQCGRNRLVADPRRALKS